MNASCSGSIENETIGIALGGLRVMSFLLVVILLVRTRFVNSGYEPYSSSMGIRELGKRIQDDRAAFDNGRGITQEELAHESGVSQGTITKYENWQVQNPNRTKVSAIATALGQKASDYYTLLYGVSVQAVPRDDESPTLHELVKLPRGTKRRQRRLVELIWSAMIPAASEAVLAASVKWGDEIEAALGDVSSNRRVRPSRRAPSARGGDSPQRSLLDDDLAESE